MSEEVTSIAVGAPRLREMALGWLQALGRLLRVRLAGPALFFILLVAVVAALAPVISPYDPLVQKADESLQPPSLAHPFGTDQLGRDVLSRMLFGARVALAVSLGAVSFGVALGLSIGIVAGYVRGLVDEVLMRVMDAIVAFPGLILALALMAALGPDLKNVIIAIGVANVPWVARVVRSQTLSVRERDYILAARAVGLGHARIMARHVFPNVLAPVIVQSTLGMGYAVLAEAGLSFLGVGVQPPTPTWGGMLRFAFGLLHQAPWLSLVPGAAIFLLVLSFNILGDALRDVLDPRLRGSI
jgi:peptide/nickel transport system permease protein